MPDFKYLGKDKYAALVIATGAIDGLPKDFKDTYAALEMHIIQRFKSKKIMNYEHAAQRYAWRLCCRTFRGGNPNEPGSVNYKGKIYLENNYLIWEKIKEDDTFLHDIMRGKYNPFESDQVALLQELYVN
jgi:hypothetical protein